MKRKLILMMCLLAGWCRADNDVITDFAGADVNIGERLFLEPRFSQYYFTNSGGDVNAGIPGDPLMAKLLTTSGHVSGPFKGQSMNCRECHLVDEKGYGPYGDHALGNRTYADFARRSPIPLRDDDRTQTPRNAQVLVDAFIPRNGPLFLHYDGQFATAHDLIIGTLTGRNYGWKPEEYTTAVHHIATIIRNDDGMGYLATEERGGRFDTLVFADALPGEVCYSNIFSGFMLNGNYLYDPRSLTPDLISPQYYMDVNRATDQQILDTVASLIEAYMRNLFFSQATNGLDFTGNGTAIFNGSPFDVFLIKNGLPQLPAAGETSAQYSSRLLGLSENLEHPKYVTDPADGQFTTHKQKFVFGAEELQGLKIFLRTKEYRRQHPSANVGNCTACHAPPAFTDFIFHNTGASQEEYDAIHGSGKFLKLAIPDLATREINYNAYLPPTPQHPAALAPFETPPSAAQPGNADLGMWNVYANPDFPAPQAGFQQILPQLLGLSTPQICEVKITAGNFMFQATNGTSGSAYFILSSTNLLLAPSVWTVIATNTFDNNGSFIASVAISNALPQRFFTLSPQLPGAADVLPLIIGLFQTSNLRDLGQSNPYLHTGRMATLGDVIRFYQTFSTLARHGEVRNGDPDLKNIFVDDTGIAPLTAFLRSLNEDYTD
ncbi:MAG TPA: hypothetical protein VK742_11025 [Candidatus Sulfotelmatobacter sp.]|nr:hypothetical protein [Candidatus Sulfotelmatobacter sp.]